MAQDYSVSWVKAGCSLVLVVGLVLGIHIYSEFGSVEDQDAEAPVEVEQAEMVPPEPAAPVQYASLEDAPVLFDPASGEPQVYYSGDPEGEIRFFSPAEFDPLTGERLLPLTREILERYRNAQAARQQRAGEAARQAAEADRRRSAAAYRQRHVNTEALSRLDRETPIVLLAVNHSAFQASLAQTLRTQGLPVRADIIREAALASDLTARDTLKRLGLTALSGHLLLGRLVLSSPEATQFDRVIKRRATLTLTVVPLRGGDVAVLEFSEVGSGFDASEAEREARGRLLEDVAKSQLMENFS